MENEFRPVIPVRDTERIEGRGVTIPEKRNIFTKPEDKRDNLRTDKLISRLSESKSFLGYLRGSLSVAKKDNNLDLCLFIEEMIKKYKEFEEIGIARLYSWRGKSGIVNIIRHPDKVIIERMQKRLPREKPSKVQIEITKQQLNAIISSLNYLRNNQPIETKDIALSYSRILGLGHQDWCEFFGDRKQHNLLTTALAFLEQEGIIHYRRDGKTTILKEKIDIQTILK